MSASEKGSIAPPTTTFARPRRLHLARARHRLKAARQGPDGVTLRYPYEVRKPEDYFDDIPDEK
jgi:non-homologous end joining protein Ku